MLTRLLYRLLLRLQSRQTRQNFGAEMLAVFDQAASAARAQGRRAYWRFGARELAGLISPANNGAGKAAIVWRWPIAGTTAGLLAGLALTQVFPEIYTTRAILRAAPSQIPERLVPGLQPVSINELRLSLGQAVLGRRSLTNIIQSHDLYRSERAYLPMEDAIELMQRRIELRPGPIDTLDIIFSDSDRFKAQRVARDLMTSLIDQSIRERATRHAATVDFLRSQAEKAAQVWESQLAAVKAANQASPGFARLVLDQDLARRHYETLRTQLIEATTRAEIEQRHQGPTLEVFDLPSLPERPSLPHWMLVLASMLVGLFGGAIFGWIQALRWRASNATPPLRPRTVGI